MKPHRSSPCVLVQAPQKGAAADSPLPLSATIDAEPMGAGLGLSISVRLYSSVLPANVPVMCIVAAPNLPPQCIGAGVTDERGVARFKWTMPAYRTIRSVYAYGVAGDGSRYKSVGFYLPSLAIG